MDDGEEFVDGEQFGPRPRGWRIVALWSDGDGGQWYGECRVSGIEPAEAVRETEVFGIAIGKAIRSLVNALPHG